MKLLMLILMLVLPVAGFSQPKTVKTGAHAFTIQWLSDNVKPGKVIIKPFQKGSYTIEGEQRDNARNEYITIKGIFDVVGRELIFDGRIVSRIAYINNGQPCELKGPAVFRASGKRKYWRLQQMLNCDKQTTDYVDIYF